MPIYRVVVKCPMFLLQLLVVYALRTAHLKERLVYMHATEHQP